MLRTNQTIQASWLALGALAVLQYHTKARSSSPARLEIYDCDGRRYRLAYRYSRSTNRRTIPKGYRSMPKKYIQRAREYPVGDHWESGRRVRYREYL